MTLTAEPGLFPLCRKSLHAMAPENHDSYGHCKACATTARGERKADRVARMKTLLADTYIPRPGWHVDAECAGSNPVVFELVDAPVGRPADAVARENFQRHMEAKRFCSSCPVVRDCLAYALERQHVGTWGNELFVVKDWEAASVARRELAGE